MISIIAVGWDLPSQSGKKKPGARQRESHPCCLVDRVKTGKTRKSKPEKMLVEVRCTNIL